MIDENGAGRRGNGKRSYNKSGHYQLKRAVKTLGSRAIDGRTAVGKALNEWRQSLIADLGGIEALSTQQACVIDLAVRTKLMLDSVDTWLLKQKSLINLRKRALLPIVKERLQLSDALSRYLAQIGLERRQPPAKSIFDMLQEEEASQNEGG